MRKIICMLLALIMCLSLCACGNPTVYEDGKEINTIYGAFGVIEQKTALGYRVVYDLDTKVVYHLECDTSLAGFLSPYLMYENGALYGAVYEGGEIVPVPYAIGITDEMIGSFFN